MDVLSPVLLMADRRRIGQKYLGPVVVHSLTVRRLLALFYAVVWPHTAVRLDADNSGGLAGHNRASSPLTTCIILILQPRKTLHINFKLISNHLYWSLLAIML